MADWFNDADWFTDADVDAVAETIRDPGWWTTRDLARAVLASLAPRIVQERADVLREAALEIDIAPCSMCGQVPYEPCDHAATLLWVVRALRARAGEIEGTRPRADDLE